MSNPANSPSNDGWKTHFARAGTLRIDTDSAPSAEQASKHRKQIEPWLSAICQSEHLALLIGNGLTTAITHEAKVTGASMQGLDFISTHAPKIVENARLSAVRTGRGTPNIEDQIRIANSRVRLFCVRG